MNKFLLGSTALIAMCAAVPASAATYLVNFKGQLAGLGAYDANVTLNVVNGQATAGAGTISIYGQTRDLGLITTATPGNITAGGPTYPVGFRSNAGDDLFGADTVFPLTSPGGLLFAIGTTTPTFGQNALINFYNDNGTLTSLVYGNVSNNISTFRAYGDTGTLAVTATVAAVPEPATWAMMITGFGFMGAGIRSRKRQSVRITYA